MSYKNTALITTLGTLVPGLVSAQTGPDLSAIVLLTEQVQNIINALLPIVVALALLFFFWNLVKFIFNAGDDEARAEGKKSMLWGILTLFIIVSIWGIIGFLGTATGIDQGGSAPVPGVADEQGSTGSAPSNQLGQ